MNFFKSFARAKNVGIHAGKKEYGKYGSAEGDFEEERGKENYRKKISFLSHK